MKETRLLMGMPITVEIVNGTATEAALESVFAYFQTIDDTFSTYKSTSEISRLNDGVLSPADCSRDVKKVLALCEETKRLTQGFFDIRRTDGSIDPAGLVKGWAIRNAAGLLTKEGFEHFYVEAGGDIQVAGRNAADEPWTVGIRNPFAIGEIVKVLFIEDHGVATSGTYIRGQHIRNPHDPSRPITDIVSLTVIGPDVYEADRFATAAFAMGRNGIEFIEQLPDFEAYMIDRTQTATMTSGFASFTRSRAALGR